MEKQDKFEETVKSFGFKAIQSHYTFLRYLETKKINHKDFMVSAKKLFKENAKRVKKLNKIIEKSTIIMSCPSCGGELALTSVREPPGKSNLKGWKSYIFCTNEDCLYEEFSKLNPQKKVKSMNKIAGKRWRK